MNQPEVRARPLSTVASRLLKRAQEEFNAGDLDAALLDMNHVMALAPDDPEVQRWMGKVAQNVGNHGTAAASFRHALAAWPDDADLHIGLGIALYNLGRRSESETQLRRACELAPGSALAWYNLAEVLQFQGEADAAIDALRRTLELDPAFTAARISLARIQTSLGEIDAAATSLREVLARHPERVDTWFALSNLKTIAFDGEDLRQLQELSANPDLSAEDRAHLQFVLAWAREDQGDYDGAWALLQDANAARRRQVRWDGVGEHRRVEAMLRAFGEPVMAATDRALGSEVTFIASLPRSGSTLVEQILASHPDVEGANEIRDLSSVIDGETARRHDAFPLWVPLATEGDWQRLGSAYLTRTSRWRRHKPRMVDKNLLNWLLAGTALSMLPGARVVIVRRDPVETCLGCYRQWFSGDEGFNYDLDELAAVYGDFWRLTRFWLDKYPGRVLDFEYETLVAEPEATIRRLLDFCGLPFDPACLEFHKTSRAVLSSPSAAQVRQPIHGGTARAARYGDKLDHLRESLREAGVAERAGA